MTMKSPRYSSILLAIFGALILCTTSAYAERLIPFQGSVTDGANAPLQGVYRVTFSIYDTETGGTPLWVETHDAVSILGGQINILLGSRTPLDDPDRNGNDSDAVSFAADLTPRYLGIKIGDDINQEMVPRHELVPSFHARVADTTPPGAIGTDQLADGAVTTVKLDPAAGVPVGAVVMWWGDSNSVPEGFEVCDGTVPTTPGALLTGAKPDLRDRLPMGVGPTVATTLGATGGAAGGSVGATSLSEAQMPSHAHGSTGNHAHGVLQDDPNQQFSGNCTDVAGGTLPNPNTFNFRKRFTMGYRGISFGGGGAVLAHAEACPQLNTHYSGIHDHPAKGSGQSHTHTSELPPYLGMHFIIRVK